MTQELKEKIISLSEQGLTSREIAAEVGLSHMSVARQLKEEKEVRSVLNCPCCGKEIVNKKGTKPKKFCSDKCRLEWWGKHRDLIKHRSKELKKCPHCGSLFEPRGKQTYCSRICYLSEVTKR